MGGLQKQVATETNSLSEKCAMSCRIARVPLTPRSARHQPRGISAASVAKSRWNAGSHREGSCRLGRRTSVRGRLVRAEVIPFVRRRKIREDARPLALRQHVFAVEGTVDLDPWFHKGHACDAIPTNDHGHHDTWTETCLCGEGRRSPCAFGRGPPNT